ncbi:hypothetical protein D083_2981 [Dickeya solani RNS 08.23.3.1.A]|nr:hypothetical protein D083_2981 [Dickeya solani RNS 08.23.3.1.A]
MALRALKKSPLSRFRRFHALPSRHFFGVSHTPASNDTPSKNTPTMMEDKSSPSFKAAV